MRRVIVLFALFALLTAALPSVFAQSGPPQAFYIALADVGVRVGESFSLSCSGSGETLNCQMNNLRLDWEWRQEVFPDSSIGCPQAFSSVQPVTTRGYVYTFIYEGVTYDYRHAQPDGSDMFLCTPTGREELGTLTIPPSNPNATNLPVTTNLSTCPIAPRLTPGAQGRVTDENNVPNNVRSGPGRSNTLLGEIPAGAGFTVINGPFCDSEFTWWQVRYNNLTGFTPEGGRDGEYFLEPVGGTTTTTATIPAAVSGLLPVSTANALQITDVWTLAYADSFTGWAYAPNVNLVAVIDPQGVRFFEVGGAGTVVYSLPVAATTTYTHIAASANRFAYATYDSATNQSRITTWQARFTPNTANAALQSNELITLPYTITGQVTDLAFNANGSILAIASSENAGALFNLRLHSVVTNAELRTIALPSEIGDVAFSPDGLSLAVAQDSGVIDLYETTNYTFTRTLRGASAAPLDLAYVIAYSPNGRWLAYADSVVDVQVYDLTSFTLARTLSIPSEGLAPRGLTFSPDSSVLLVGGQNPTSQTIASYLFDANTGVQLRELPNTFGPAVFTSYNGLLTIFVSPNSPRYAVRALGVR